MASELEQKWEEPLRRYADLLASYGAARLTGSRNPSELYDLHVKDSLHSVGLLPRTGKVIDVGSGGGLPGMVWAICRPDLDVTLLDSTKKKCHAMSEIAAELELNNVSVVWARCEEHALCERERYAFASARALAHAGVVAEYLAPLVKRGGKIAAFKGPKGIKELEEIGDKWNIIGLSDPVIMPYVGNTNDDEVRNYFFVIWEKLFPTPKLYPRKPGTAQAKSWWTA
jgi:16S rRNA (guanine527-N7)-methyltransferase